MHLQKFEELENHLVVGLVVIFRKRTQQNRLTKTKVLEPNNRLNEISIIVFDHFGSITDLTIIPNTQQKE